MIEICTPWKSDFGAQLRATAGEALPSVSPDRLKQALLARGFVLLRGFQTSVPLFQELARGLFDRAMVYGGARERVTADDTIQAVEPGSMALRPHCEMAYTSVRPDIALFYCETPAREGGETTVVDGARVCAALAPATRKLLEERRVLYVNRVKASGWQRMFKIESKDQLAGILPRLGFHATEFDAAGNLVATHASRPLVPGRRGTFAYAESFHNFPGDEPEAWTNDVKKTWTALEDGPLPDEVRAEVQELCRQSELPIGWQAGDVAVIDNWSTLHGRTAFTDLGRRIYAGFGYAAWARPGDRRPPPFVAP